ncbi:MAG: DUF3368 domain-containing protein [Bacteroidota bacterium]
MAFVVTDASPLIGLERAGYLDIIPAVFAQVAAPPAVVAEVGHTPVWLGVVQPQDAMLVAQLRAVPFGAGEAEVLAVATERRDVTAVLDERRARAYAQRQGVPVVGTVGMVLQAKRRGHLQAVRPVLDALRASGFRVGDGLYAEALARAGEA